MQTCYNCGKVVSDETLICPECGALVRRYNNPPPREESAPVQPEPIVMEPIRPMQKGKVRFHGGLKFWLIFLCIFSGYLMFSSLCSVLVGTNAEVFREMFAGSDLPVGGGLSMQEVLDIAESAVPLFASLCFLFALKLGCHIWLLASGRRVPFFVSIGISLAALIGVTLMGGSLLVILYFFDPLLTWLSLRRYWPYMEK